MMPSTVQHRSSGHTMILLQEIHHRVANELQGLVGALSPPRAKQMLDGSGAVARAVERIGTSPAQSTARSTKRPPRSCFRNTAANSVPVSCPPSVGRTSSPAHRLHGRTCEPRAEADGRADRRRVVDQCGQAQSCGRERAPASGSSSPRRRADRCGRRPPIVRPSKNRRHSRHRQSSVCSPRTQRVGHNHSRPRLNCDCCPAEI